MTVKELKELLNKVDENAEVLFCSMREDECSQVDDIADVITSANEEEAAFYLYSVECNEIFSK